MRSNLTLSDPRDRALSVAATAAIHVALGVALLTGLVLNVDRHPDDGLKTFDVTPPPSPPPLSPDQPNPSQRDRTAPAGKKADPSPIVVPPAQLPTVQPVAAAPIAGTGPSSKAGSAASGNGTKSGGTGTGGGGGGTIGTEARLLAGNRGRVPRELLRVFAADNGFAHLLLTIGETGTVTGCSVVQGTGSGAVDQALCQVMVRQSRWSPALDTAGRPISVQLRYTSTWRK
ncbi:MAG: TonB family protein [Sphingomicrobium sp.]